MKKKFFAYTAALLCLLLCGCSEGSADSDAAPAVAPVTEPANEPELSQIRSICELATLECDYHNVAKMTKSKGSGIAHWGEKDRTLWIEYIGTAKIGIDMTKVTMKTEGNVYTITIPPAEIQSIKVDPDSLNEDSYVISKDGVNANAISMEDQQKAVQAAQDNMQQEILNDSILLMNAQDRAKELIENYFNQLEKISGTDLVLKWDFADQPSGTAAPTESAT